MDRVADPGRSVPGERCLCAFAGEPGADAPCRRVHPGRRASPPDWVSGARRGDVGAAYLHHRLARELPGPHDTQTPRRRPPARPCLGGAMKRVPPSSHPAAPPSLPHCCSASVLARCLCRGSRRRAGWDQGPTGRADLRRASPGCGRWRTCVAVSDPDPVARYRRLSSTGRRRRRPCRPSPVRGGVPRSCIRAPQVPRFGCHAAGTGTMCSGPSRRVPR